MYKQYTNKKFLYTDPSAYDRRLQSEPVDRYCHSLWNPILLKNIEDNVKEGQTVCDLGCGTFIYTQHMGKAQKIYAVDVNRSMLDYGLPKLHAIKDKVTVLCEDALHTSIPDRSCDVVWIDGLYEFVNLDDLFSEVERIIRPNSKFIILFQNKIHPFNILVSIAYGVLGRNGKKYRTLYEFKNIARKHNFKMISFESTGIFFYVPSFLQKYFVWSWYLANYFYKPFQHFFPMGTNLLCIFEKE
jgi:ubiquinone/menaquinone biosynthesis C-methylase UbiE